MDETNHHAASDNAEDSLREGNPRSQESTETITGVIKCVVIVNSVCFIVCSCFAIGTKTDGSWSSWESWSTCSTSCNGGLRSRTRTCTNPVPSILGEYCYGNPNEIELCSFEPCSDGKWTDWETWSSCSVTCGTGIRSRLRNCTNPKPSLTGSYCDGPPIQIDICRNQACADTKIAFTAYEIAGSAYVTNAVRFPKVLENHGEGYNSDTGTFTCSTAGLYHFAVTLTVMQKTDGRRLLCYIYINNLEKILLYVYKPPSSDESYTATASGTFHLNKDDVVYIGGCLAHISDIHNDKDTSFTGVLVTPDI